GQSIVSQEIQNWIGTVSIHGEELAKRFKEHLKAYADKFVDIKEHELVQRVTKIDGGFELKTAKHLYKARTVLVTTGSYRKKLEVPGAAEYENKGISYCASCDAPLFAGQDAVVIGGGNAAFESAAQLAAHCPTVTILHRNDKYKADPVTVEKVLSHKNVKAIPHAKVLEIKGDKFVKSIVYQVNGSEEKIELPVGGVFVEIGLLPTTYFVKDLVKLNEYNQIIVDPKTQQTNVPGVWAAGDSTDGLYHQNNIAAGDAVKALEDIYMHLHTK
ncbi:FAD-dependent oxidoreductase, partial [Candidatus Parcubacteria bacterium]|nr:FAD-dependent oxidoreductase [Candidatus Parcubacteria bacterium]